MPDNIVSYFQSIFLISITGTVTEAIFTASAGNSKTLHSGLKLIFSLCLLLSVFIPAAEIVSTENFYHTSYEINSHHLNANEYNIITATKKQLQNDIAEKINSELGIKPTSVCIELVTDEKEKSINVEIKSVTVNLSDHDKNHSEKANSYAKQLLGLVN